ncbi:hypothetical protein E4665_17745 [Sporolactobacillus shoreae]|uniref:Uncharacterized protein n=1 Tax=Sporolactobacillus shoreae TaxID=1465501 RepID=A0A4Z0GIP6_9BACL|nr:hypothetical protein [Sporolactobacillus shoreae]TGA95652.1 hypothetical protein E4665_17745 [Sporolactobacillus shoreae]
MDARKKQRLIVQDLLDRCNGCPLQADQRGEHPDQIHGGCPLYTEIREAGKALDALQKPEEPKLTPEKYYALKQKGWKDQEINKKLHMSVYNWKLKIGMIHKRRS